MMCGWERSTNELRERLEGCVYNLIKSTKNPKLKRNICQLVFVFFNGKDKTFIEKSQQGAGQTQYIHILYKKRDEVNIA